MSYYIIDSFLCVGIILIPFMVLTVGAFMCWGGADGDEPGLFFTGLFIFFLGLLVMTFGVGFTNYYENAHKIPDAKVRIFHG